MEPFVTRGAARPVVAASLVHRRLVEESAEDTS